MKMNVYEYTIKDSKVGTYKGSYTIKAGCPKEKELKATLKSHKVDSFDHETRQSNAPKKEFIVLDLSLDNNII